MQHYLSQPQQFNYIYTLYFYFILTVKGNENYSGGRGEWGVFEPDDEFMRNIDNYTENRYLNVGKHPANPSF